MKRLVNYLKSENMFRRLLLCFIGNFIACLAYNAFSVPNHIVTGGVSGLAILVNEVFGISIPMFITVSNIVLIIISLLLLGFNKTLYSIIGFIIYDAMIIVTEPLAGFFNIQFDSYLLSIIFWAIIAGVGYGLIYRTGFNTGGSDIMVAILQKYIIVPYEILSNAISFIIVGLGAKTFGIVACIYALVFVKVCNYMTNKLQIGESNAKVCYIHSNHKGEIEEYLHNEQKLSYTLINSTNGIGILPRTIIFTVVPTEQFDDIKKKVLIKDKHARIIAMDSYTVYGGKTNKFISIEC